MRIDGLEQPQYDPRVHGEDVQVFCDGCVDDWDSNGAKGENHGLDRGGVLGGEAEGGGVLVVELVDLLVKSGCVQSAVKPVVPGVFEDEEDGDLVGHFPPGWERDGRGEAAELG